MLLMYMVEGEKRRGLQLFYYVGSQSPADSVRFLRWQQPRAHAGMQKKKKDIAVAS